MQIQATRLDGKDLAPIWVTTEENSVCLFTFIFKGGSRGRGQGVPPPPGMTCGFLIQLVFCQKKKTMWFIGVEVEQETSAPLLKKYLDTPLILMVILLLLACFQVSSRSI